MDVTLFTTPGCQACRATERRLTRAGIDHTTRDLSRDPEALTYVRDTLGHRLAPVVLVRGDDGQTAHWSGYRPDNLDALATSIMTGTPTAEPPAPEPIFTVSPGRL